MKSILKKIIPVRLLDVIRILLSSIGKTIQKSPRKAWVFSDPKAQIFFGYYDVNPFSDDNRYLLATRAPAENISPHLHHPDLELGYYDLEQKSPTFKTFAKSATWNWQQGCRLQWFGDNVLYNTKTDERYICVLQNPFSGEIIRTFEKPLYSASRYGNFGLTLDFDRLHECRPGYGYNHFPKAKREDTIWYTDLRTGECNAIFTMEQIRAFEPHGSMELADHYFNHLSISPKGTRFMVLHLWVGKNGKRRSRMITCDLQDKNSISCPNNSGHVSHYCWSGEDKIILFGTEESNGQRYYAYDLISNQTAVLGASHLKEDGHPTYLENEVLITDTYPNLLRHQSLLRYNIKQDTLKKLAAYHVPLDFVGEVRCDLHPRVNNSGDKICVDIVLNGRRAMCVICEDGYSL